MANKKNIFLLSFFIFLFITIPYASSEGNYNRRISLNLHANDIVVLDKVFTFEPNLPNNSLIEDMELERSYKYFISIRIVSSQKGNISISITDPDYNQFNIFDAVLDSEYELLRYYKIPFGTVIAGNYTIKFAVITEFNLNIHIMIEKGPKLFYDVLSSQNIESIIFQNATLFHDLRTSLNETFHLKSQYLYKFCFERISPITIKEDNTILFDVEIFDPYNRSFIIYHNESFALINNIEKSRFGTTEAGTYILKITVLAEVKYVNIAYAVIKYQKLGHGIEPNITVDSPSSPPTNITHETSLSIPRAWNVPIIVLAISLVGVTILLVSKHMRKHSVKAKEP